MSRMIDDASVAQYGGAGDAADRGDLRTDRLDHDLAAADQFVGHQAGGVLAGAHQHHRNRRVGLGDRRGFHADVERQLLQAVFVFAIGEGGAVAAQVRRHFFARQAHHAFDGRQRQRVVLVAGAHHQRVADGQRQRQADREARALARLAVHVQGAAEFLDLGGHHVHADAAAGLLRQRAGGREARLEHQLHDVVVGQRLVGRISPSARPLSRIAREVHARAVVADVDDDFRAFALQVQVDLAGRGLAARRALVRRLDAVHHRVAQQVLERRQHALEHLPVQFAGGAFDDQLGALVGIGGGLAHDARQPLHVALERHHAGAHQSVLQLGDRARLQLQLILGVAHQALEQLLEAGHVVGRFGQRARVLLDRRITVELQRIKSLPVARLLVVPVQDLRFGLDLELAQLFLQSRDGARELGEVEFHRARAAARGARARC